MLNRKKILVAASIAGLMAASAVAHAGASFPGQDGKKSCCMNGCGGKKSCTKGSKNACGGHNACKSQCSMKGSADMAAKVENGTLTS